MLGVILGLAAAMGFGSTSVFARLGLQHIRSTTATLVSLMVGSAITMGLALLVYTDEILALFGLNVLVRPAPMGDPAAFLWFLLFGVVAFAVARSLSYAALNMIGVSRVAPIIGTDPLFATMLAITIGGEAINSMILMGTFSIFGGLTLILSQR